MNSSLPRRAWLTRQVQGVAVLAARSSLLRVPPCLSPGASWRGARRTQPLRDPARMARLVAQALPIDPGPLHALALRAIEAAMTAGATYADVRLTRVVMQHYRMPDQGIIDWDTDEVGIGVRALVHGYWGFAASPFWEPDDVVRLARAAVAQAHENAKGTPRAVDVGHYPVVTGTWVTPIQIDPFAISIEEKLDAITYWKAVFGNSNLYYKTDGLISWMNFARQERVVATSEGALFTQTLYETGGNITVYDAQNNQIAGLGGMLGLGENGPTANVHAIDVAGKGWELFLDAKIDAQSPQLQDEIRRLAAVGSKPATIGRYTLVCDGATMADLTANTLGVATQLDRALGYEADAGGTSFLDDPLAMVGTLQIASPLVTVTANRSAPAALATVQWDDEGVVPEPFTLVKDGVLVDFQTTREQAAWLAPYYQQHGRPVRSHGCAAAEDAHYSTLQHMPNLALEPSASAIRLEDLVADVTDGILVEGGSAECDFQARNGLLFGAMREIKNGRVGRRLQGGAVLFNSQELWKHIQAVGGRPTQMGRGVSQYTFDPPEAKGQPAQMVSHSTYAVAATIANQPLIDPERTA